MGPPKWHNFQHKFQKNLILRGPQIYPEFDQILNQFSLKIRPPQNIKILKKPLVFPWFFENRRSNYRPQFWHHFGLPKPSILDAKIHQKPLRAPSRRAPKKDPFFNHFLCWFMLILGSQNGAKNQHKFNQKTDPFLDPLKSCKNLPRNPAHGPGTRGCRSHPPWQPPLGGYPPSLSCNFSSLRSFRYLD